jgi:hypothetical protein
MQFNPLPVIKNSPFKFFFSYYVLRRYKKKLCRPDFPAHTKREKSKNKKTIVQHNAAEFQRGKFILYIYFFSVLFCFFFLLFLLGGWECREKYRVTKRMETVSSIIQGILYMSEIPKNRHLLCKAFRNVKRALGGKNEQKSRLLIKKKILFSFFFSFFYPFINPKSERGFCCTWSKTEKKEVFGSSRVYILAPI